MKGGMSAFGTKRTSLVALHVSAFGGRADITEPPAENFVGVSCVCLCQLIRGVAGGGFGLSR
jgi:hypothetical protein